jgi:AcrR family transcriptional regulator
VTVSDTGLHLKPELPEPDSSPDPAHTAATPRSRASTRRREAILDAALTVAAAGGYEAVQMRQVAERAGIAVGTLYRYFPSKTHLLVSALTREFQRLDATYDWTTSATTSEQRLDRLTADLHERWQRDPLLTEAMTRAFVVADTTAAAAVNLAAAVIERLLARTLSGGIPAPVDQRVAEVIADIWLANLTAFIGQRASAADTRDRIDRATRRVFDSLATITATI